MKVRPLAAGDLPGLPERLASTGRSHLAVTPVRTFDLRELEGFCAVEGRRVIGVVTYAVDGERCEIVTLDAFEPGRGVGTAFVGAVTSAAVDRECRRLTVFTTNDNLDAQRFYTARGFRLFALYPDAMAAVRGVKPGIPAAGRHGIPLRDMVEYEMGLPPAG